MTKTILITGSTDGIGLEAAKALSEEGHTVLLHGRSAAKLKAVKAENQALNHATAYRADLSNFKDVTAMAEAVLDTYDRLDVLINNAGVFKTENPITPDGLDIRFVVNTIAPYLLTQKLLPIMSQQGRIINLSSAAQAPINIQAFTGEAPLSDGEAYAQSKLAITMWSQHMAEKAPQGPIIIPVNPGSLLATKMVKEAYGLKGKDINIGRDILVRLSLDDEIMDRSGEYYDNDAQRFSMPHPDASDRGKSNEIIAIMDTLLAEFLSTP